jgi:hypothetical protein
MCADNARTAQDLNELRRETMSNIAIKDLAETTDLDRTALAEVRGGFCFGGFFLTYYRGGNSTKEPAIDGESTDAKHRDEI